MSLATPSGSITSTHDLTETSTSKFSGKIYGQVRVIVYCPSFFSLIYNCSLIITRSVWYRVVLFMINQHYYPA